MKKKREAAENNFKVEGLALMTGKRLEQNLLATLLSPPVSPPLSFFCCQVDTALWVPGFFFPFFFIMAGCVLILH